MRGLATPRVLDTQVKTNRIVGEQLLSERTGPICSARDIPLSPGCPEVYLTSYVAVAAGDGKQPFSITGSGSSIDQDEARRLAFYETIERVSTSTWNTSDIIVGTSRELSSSFRVVLPSEYALYQPNQLPVSGYSEFTDDTIIGWVKGYSLTHSAPTLVPACLSYIRYKPRDVTSESIIGPGTSSGAACGETYTSALVRAICELAEREALLVTWWNKLARRRVVPRDGSWLKSVIDNQLHRSGLEYALVDISTDFPIVILLSVLIDHSQSPPKAYIGASAGFSAEKTALKALTDVAGLYRAYSIDNTCKHYAGPNSVESIDDHARYYWDDNNLAALAFLIASNETVLVDELSVCETTSSHEQLRSLLSFTRDNELEVVVLDLSEELAHSMGQKVVKAIIPQVIPVSFGHRRRCLGGRRLYELPVKIGLRQAPNRFLDLNENPHPFA